LGEFQIFNKIDQAEANANDAIGLIQTEEGALTETHSMLQRMTTLATQAANGTYSTSDEGATARSSIQKEVDELAKEISRIAENTKYNGLSPLNNSKAIQLQIGPTSGEVLSISGRQMTAKALAVTGLSMGSVTGANSAITKIQTAINNVSAYRADLGAKQNRLEHTINNLKTTNENVTAAESRIRDTDMAKEIASYTKNNILSQAAQSMLAQANQSGQGVLTLLRG
jgi:flagellin